MAHELRKIMPNTLSAYISYDQFPAGTGRRSALLTDVADCVSIFEDLFTYGGNCYYTYQGSEMRIVSATEYRTELNKLLAPIRAEFAK